LLRSFAQSWGLSSFSNGLSDNVLPIATIPEIVELNFTSNISAWLRRYRQAVRDEEINRARDS
jgi:hypothetical protein